MKQAERLLLLVGTNLDFVRTVRAVFWGGDGSAPPVGNGHKRGLGRRQEVTHRSSTRTFAPIVRAWSRRVERHARSNLGTSTADAQTNWSSRLTETLCVGRRLDREGWVIGSEPDEDTICLSCLTLLIRMKALEIL